MEPQLFAAGVGRHLRLARNRGACACGEHPKLGSLGSSQRRTKGNKPHSSESTPSLSCCTDKLTVQNSCKSYTYASTMRRFPRICFIFSKDTIAKSYVRDKFRLHSQPGTETTNPIQETQCKDTIGSARSNSPRRTHFHQ